MNRVLISCVAAAFLSAVGAGQLLTLPPQPVAPGSMVTVTAFNNTGTMLVLPCGQPLWLQHADGSAVTHPFSTDCGFAFPAGTTATLGIQLPATGPGSSGSFALRAWSAAARLDVGAASPAFPTIRAYPPLISSRSNAHQVAFLPNIPSWEVNNTGTLPHTFTAGDVVRVFTPGGTVPVVTASIAGITVPAQLSLSGELPILGLAPGPYTVEMSWFDPGAASVVSARHGISNGDISVDLPGGHVIPLGGSLPVELGFSNPSWSHPTYYAFCAGVLPGSTALPGGPQVPLVPDAAVLASLSNGIGGLLTNNIGVLPPVGNPWVPLRATGLGVTHPGPAYSGIVVRVAALSLEPVALVWGASQGEDLIIQ